MQSGISRVGEVSKVCLAKSFPSCVRIGSKAVAPWQRCVCVYCGSVVFVLYWCSTVMLKLYDQNNLCVVVSVVVECGCSGVGAWDGIGLVLFGAL